MALSQDDLNQIELIMKNHNETLIETFESWAGKICVSKLEYEKDRYMTDRKLLVLSLVLMLLVVVTIPQLSTFLFAK